MNEEQRVEFESFMEGHLGDCIDRRRCKNGDGNDYMSFDMGMACKVWQHMQQKLDALAAENAILKSVFDTVTDLSNEPEFHYQGMGCGLEDRGIVDRYEAMKYGWDEAMERIYGEVIPSAEEVQFPTTDAILNAVRADAIDEFGKYHNFSDKLFIQQEAKKYAERLRANATKGGSDDK